MAEDDWAGWRLLTQELGDQIQLIGDDMFVTNTAILARGIDLHWQRGRTVRRKAILCERERGIREDDPCSALPLRQALGQVENVFGRQ